MEPLGVTVQVQQIHQFQRGKPLTGHHRLSEVAKTPRGVQKKATGSVAGWFFPPFLQNHKQFSKICKSLSGGTLGLKTGAAPGFAVLYLEHISSTHGSEAQTPFAQRQGDALEAAMKPFSC